MVDTDNDGIPDTMQLLVGPGNIGDGIERHVLIFNLTLPLANLGLKGAEVKIETQWDRQRGHRSADGREAAHLRPAA